MNTEQEFTPKYWVGHNPEKDDVYLDTASKSWDDADKKMRLLFGEDYQYETVYKVSLVEIRLVDLP